MISLATLASLGFASRVRALAEPSPVGEWLRSASESSRSQPGLPADPRVVWRRIDSFGGRGSEGLLAVAADASGGWLAVGGDNGISFGRPLRDSRIRSLAIREVRDLSFGPGGELYIATARGFWVLPLLSDAGTNELQEFSPGTGDGSRRVNRIATGPGFVALATEDGAFISGAWDAGPSHSTRTSRLKWKRLDAGFPKGSVALVAAEPREDGTCLWVVVGSALWRVQVSAAGVASDLREVLVPGRHHGKVPVDLVTDLPDQSVALVYANSIVYRSRDASSDRRPWKVVRPVLPPGASISRLGYWRARYWLSTDRGLLLADSLTGPWRRAGPPAGRASAHAAAAVGTRLYVSSTLGLIYAEVYEDPVDDPVTDDAEKQRVAAVHALQIRWPRVPSITEVHRNALRHQGLETRVFEDAWRGVRRRGWLPAVGLRLGVDHDRLRRRDHDQIFVSGNYRLLHDYDKDQSLDLGAALTLTWDFRDLAYEPDQIELSRESRLVIGLRDDVLDEINQLYFERLAIQADLSAQRSGFERGRDPTAESPQDPSRAVQREARLELRLQELTAGLDAWTGGWFSKQLAPTEIEGM